MLRITKQTVGYLPQLLATGEPLAGSVLVDKDLDWTSFNVVAKLRGLLHIKKIGHAGTLDPLATGLLIVCFGKATKTISTIQSQPKKYRALVKLGAITDSFDREFEEKEITPTDTLSPEQIEEAAMSFVGKIKQKAPMFSAKKVNGERLYKKARRNETVEIKESDVEIYSITILRNENPFLEIDVECSKGTYIRSLARDIGAKLGVGGYLYALRRTQIGANTVEDALTIDEIKKVLNPES